MFYYRITEKDGIKELSYILEVSKQIKNTDIAGYDIISIPEKEVELTCKVYKPKTIKKPMFINIHNLTPEFIKELYG